MPFPLSNAGTTGIGHDDGTYLLQIVKQSVALGGVAYLLRSRADDELGFRADMQSDSLTRDGCSARQVLIRRVGARTDQCHLHRHGVVLLRSLRTHLGYRRGGIGRERTVEVRFYLREIDVNQLVKVLFRIGQHLSVGPEVVTAALCGLSQFSPARLPQIVGGMIVEGEQTACGAQFGTHVANGGFTRGGEAFGALSEIFQDGIGTAFDGQHTENLQDDILWCGPTRELAGEVHTDETRHTQFPRLTGQHVDGVGTTHANGYHTQSAGIGRMRVGTDHHAAGEGVVLQHHLMNDAGTRCPKADAVFGRSRAQEVIHLFILLLGYRQIGVGALIGQDEVVAMH